MSRAFVKDDADDDPVVVPARAPLPEGVPNRVTPEGLAALERERAALEAGVERARREADPRAEAAAAGQLEAVRARLASARVVDLPDVPDAANVGVVVALRRNDGAQVRFRIVGVDEADPASARVAFTAPVAAAALGKRVGERFSAHVGDRDVEFEVEALER
ncbi:MAG: GreA/GreB family elongation factor [Trueperaceae bacterium]